MTWPYLVRLDVADHVANSPCDTLAKRVIASNLDHLANSHGQTLVNWASADSNGATRVGSAVALWRSASFPLKLRPDGSPFRLRVRLRGRRIGAGTAVTFYVWMDSVGQPSESFATSSTTGAWLTPAGDGFLSPTASHAAAFRRNLAGTQSLGGAPVAYTEVMTSILVTCAGVGSNNIELTGLHVSEFIGA